MKYFLAVIICFLAVVNMDAQELNTTDVNNIDFIDSISVVKITPEPVLDSTLMGVSIFYLIDSTNTTALGSVKVNQPSYMGDALNKFVASNSDNTQHGYRIRVFFSNKQNARVESEELEEEFKGYFPLIPTYRSYTTPYFKIVVGDYRTKSDAMQIYGSIKRLFPNAIIVKDYIDFPALD